MLLVGATLTALLLWLPALHLVRWSGGTLTPPLAAALALPVLALLAAAWRPRPALALWAFPVSHLPALVLDPGLSGPLVYGGATGLATLSAVVAVAAAWVAVTLWPTAPGSASVPAPPASPGAPPRRGLEPLLPAVALLMSLGIYAAFTLSALPAASDDPLAASLTLLVGVTMVWLSVGRLIVGAWGDVLLERDTRARLATALEHPPRTRWTDLWWAVFLAFIGAIVGAIWYLR